MNCYGCRLKVKNLKELSQHLQSHQECVDKIEEDELNRQEKGITRRGPLNPIFRRQENRKVKY